MKVGMKRIGLFSVLLITCLSLSSDLHAKPRVNALYTRLHVRVLDLTKDAQLIGLTKESIRSAIVVRLLKNNVIVEDEITDAILTAKITTVDVEGPHVVSSVRLELQEVGRLNRRYRKPQFLVSWDRGRMIVSNPVLHPSKVRNSVHKMAEDFIRSSLH